MFQSIGDILELLLDQNWESFRYNVLSSPDIFRHLASAISSCSQLNGMTLLHAIVKYNPPLEIVARMIELCPDLPAATDCVRRTPLHVAAGLRASASLIELLAHAHPAACDAQDEEAKTPLHFACDSSCVLFEDDFIERGSIPKQPPNHEAVAVLLSYSVHAVTLEDDEDMTPLEHAIQSDASMETVKLLQHETRQATQLNEGYNPSSRQQKACKFPHMMVNL
jgi:ankyrin repeat protein